MKRTIFLLVFIILAVSSLSAQVQNRSVYIEGSAENPGHLTFFLNNFKMEAAALGYQVVENKAMAGYIIKFHAQSYNDSIDPEIRNIVLVSLIYNETGREMVSFGWPYATIESMYEYNQFVYFRAAVLIPALSETDFADFLRRDDTWRNKWLYLRVSADYTVLFHRIQQGGEPPDGLISDGHKFYAAYDGDYNSPNFLDPIEHIIWPTPGMTVGAEFHFLDFMSVEANFQLSFGDTRNNYAVNLALGTELKFPLKFFKNYAISPYAAFLFPIVVPAHYIRDEYPKFFLGGGVQFNINGGKMGAFFVDAKFMMPTKEIITENYTWEFSPLPTTFHYKRFTLGISAGYKFGFLHRN
jgi:hypothetical protein